MAKNKDPNLIQNPDGTVSDPNPEIKAFSLSDIGIDGAFIKETIKPLMKDIVVKGIRDELKLGKSELSNKSKAYKVSLFFKEIAWTSLYITIAALIVYTFFTLFWRWVGL